MQNFLSDSLESNDPANASASTPASIPLAQNPLYTHSVGVAYGDHVALQDVTLSFASREVCAFIGPSGCGKSTYLRSLNLMNREIPNCTVTGEIYFRGANVNVSTTDVYTLRAHVGMVFQQPTPFRKSIRENILFAPRRHGRITSRAQADELVEKSLTQAALWDEVKDKLDTSAWALSGGQQQRLCIARTLAMEPDVVLLDEPTSALDPISTFAVEETIRSVADAGPATIIVTHNMEQAARIADKTAFFYMGRMLEHNTTANIFSDPQNERLQDYLSGRFS